MRFDRGAYAANVSVSSPLWRVYGIPLILSLICILAEYKTNLLVFHTLTEFFSVVIGLTAMIVAATTTHFTKNQFVIFISLAAGWWSFIDIAHILAYKKNLLPHGGGDLSTQLWISARFFQAGVFLFSIYFFRHTLRIWVVNLGFFLITLIIFTAIFSGHFPTTYIDHYGVTWFKLYCEWGVILILIIALILFWYERAMIPKELLFYISLSMIAMILSDLALSDYKRLFGLEHVAGQIFKIFSIWFIYIALVEQTLRRPFAILTRAATTYDNIPDPTFIVNEEGIIHQANKAAGTFADLKPEELVGLSSHALFHNQSTEQKECPVCSSLPVSRDKFIKEIKTGKRGWVECSLSPMDSSSFPDSWIQTIRNITSRKRAEKERKQLTYDLGERIKELQCLYQLSNLIALRDLGVEELLTKTVNILPAAFQFPECMAAKIESIWGEFYSDSKAKKLPYQLEKEFKIENGTLVKISVYYCVQPPVQEGIFLAEESALLDSVATLLQEALPRF
ncbi:MASE3 domain-containing protein [Legionella parisiensis]|uniref:PAS domain-containing protein n=1 Tax=Legionella parisiensis TaxID=45071 RepID=A0A1E5JNJ9_9GAMM|nr:MASE3 domain-containing protein [Legionella parisiensis]KTD44321.1 sensory protein (PAS domain) [Legionella parisiensis]OEH45923.1 hypothetical protein lpari_03111 [Legionella parisiensis]STX71947.1 sensory protein (PAS domain) [Legionella parisiensis]